ncbi:hypothetical protein KM043_010181 [Ampulex compressa]|nr:hypothetical protein KM043_010181 [Ampulex compressa]
MGTFEENELLSKLNVALDKKNWDELPVLLKPKLFGSLNTGDRIASEVLAKVAYILVSESLNAPVNVKIVCLKCLANSCFNSYKYKKFLLDSIEEGKYCQKLYEILADNEEVAQRKISDIYPRESCFPYEGIAEWATDYVVSNKVDLTQLSIDQLHIVQYSIQFLCNLFTFACYEIDRAEQYEIPECFNSTDLKNAIMYFMCFEHFELARASCAFIHNSLKGLDENYYAEAEKNQLFPQLLKSAKNGFQSSAAALFYISCQPNILRNNYEDLSMENKLHMLHIIYNAICESVYQPEEENTDGVLTRDAIEFLTGRFCRKSDLILKTVDTYLEGIEPTEIILLLDIIGILTSDTSERYSFLKTNKNLLINCTFLLKSLHMVGKESDNYFTPMQKLSDVALSSQMILPDDEEKNSNSVGDGSSTKDEGETKVKSKPEDHPAFGFKAGLIRVTGNMCYKNKVCQDLLREMDAIPLLLDCCNIDARNPLIMQWTILALRNLCEDNPENQGIIGKCTKVGVVDNEALKEMGVTLHEEEGGKSIGIVPLIRDQKR